MARAAKLRVYCMPAGFYDALVAAPSQKAALKAWGLTTDLFAAGRASVVEEEALQAEALAHPGVVIKRPRGNADDMLGPEPPAPGPPKLRKAAVAKRPPPPPPDRSKLDAAERALADAERDLAAELDKLARERAELDRREREARASGEARLNALRRERERAEAAYARAVDKSRKG